MRDHAFRAAIRLFPFGHTLSAAQSCRCFLSDPIAYVDQLLEREAATIAAAA
jgi:hypothetical protein